MVNKKVGATFAYFSVTTNGTTTSTTVTATTPDIGTIALSQGQQNLYLKLDAASMANDPSVQKAYYSTTTESYATSAVPQVLATATVSGGEENAKYNCNTTMTVKLDAGGATFEETDLAQLVLSGSSNMKLDSNQSKTIDLETDFTTLTDGSGVSVPVTFSLVADGASGATETISGYLTITNSTEDQTSRLSNKTISVTIEIAKLTCNLQPTAGD